MKLAPVLATALVCMSCCAAFGWLCCWAYRRDSRRLAATAEVRRADAQTSDRTTAPFTPAQKWDACVARLTPAQHTLQVQMFADARTARYGRIDDVLWEAEIRERSTS